MGNLDKAAKKLIKDNEVFADAMNVFKYHGKRVVLPEHLSDTESVHTVVINDKVRRKTYGKERYRDAVKKVCVPGKSRYVYMITGFENQAKMNRAMPVRNMLYDAMLYTEQVEEKSDTCKSEGFITDLPEGEKLLPVMTAVINYGTEPWTAPLTLHELLDTDDKEILSSVPDYRINILDPHTMSDEEIEKFESNLREVFYCVKYNKNKEKLYEVINGNEDRFKRITLNAKNVIESISDLKIKSDGKGEFNMCKAIEDMRKDAMDEGIKKGREKGREEGRREGHEEGRREGHEQGKEQCTKVMKYLMKNYTAEKSNEEIICEMTGKFDISAEEALGYLESFLED